MSKRKTFFKTISAILSLLILLTVLPLGVSATDTSEVTPDAVTEDVTIQDVIAGAASIYDLYGEDYVLHIPDAAETYDPSDDNRVRSEEGDSLNVIVIDNGDGTNTMTIYDYPVKFVNEKGEIEDISLDLTAAGNGGFKTKKSNTKTVFPKKATEGISLSRDKINIKLTPKISAPLISLQTARASSVATVEPIASEVNVTKLDNETVSYYYNSSTRLEYSLTYTGFKEDIVVSEYTGQTEYKFTLETGGLTLQESDGSYYLTNENGEVKAYLGEIIILTADGKNDTFGYMTHKEIEKNQSYELTIHVDAEWLADENTTYPIRIDPTVSLREGEPAIEDVTINSEARSDYSGSNLYIGYREDYGISRVLMRFPGLVLSDVLSSKNIRSAEVRLYNNSANPAPIKAIAYMFTGNAWSEETVSWANVNANSYTHFMSQHRITTLGNLTSDSDRWYSFNIIDHIKYCMEPSQTVSQGIMFKAEDSVESGGVTKYNSFVSFDGAEAQRPQIVVNYDNGNSSNTKPFGWFDTVTDTYASGWAWCVDAPDEACTVSVEMTNNTTGQTFVKECIANRPRLDVAQAGYGTGNYGFYCSLDWSECTPGQYTVRAVAIAPGGSRSDPNDCYELLSAKNYNNPTYDQIIPEDAYYINNKERGTYLLKGHYLNRSSLLKSLTGDVAQWFFEQSEGGYFIRNMYEDEEYLVVFSDSSTKPVDLRTYNANEKYKYIWDIQLAEYGGCYIRSRYNGKYLFINSNGDVEIDSSVGAVGTADNNNHVWRIVKTTEYGNTESYSSRELTGEAFFEGLYVMVGHTESIPFSAVIPNTLWAEPSDFTYEISAKDSEGNDISTTAVSIDQLTGRVTCSSLGNGEKITIKATHKVTGLVFNDIDVHICSGDLRLIDGDLNIWNSISHKTGYWAKNKVLIYADPLDAQGLHKEYFDSAITYAIAQWNNALSGYLTLEMTTEKSKADICCYAGSDEQIKSENACNYSGDISEIDGGAIHKESVNKCYFSYGNNNKIFVQHIKHVLFIRSQSTYIDMSDDIHYKHILLHEFGHALGYSGHTGTLGTLMYPKSNGDSEAVITSEEIAFIRHIYSLRGLIEE